eukprot:998717-Pleurochrysis_carterae.AAC.2
MTTRSSPAGVVIGTASATPVKYRYKPADIAAPHVRPSVAAPHQPPRVLRVVPTTVLPPAGAAAPRRTPTVLPGWTPPPASTPARSGWARMRPRSPAACPPLHPRAHPRGRSGRPTLRPPRIRSWPLALRRALLPQHRVDDRGRSRERLYPQSQRHNALRLRHGCVDAVGAAEAGVGCDPRLLVVFHLERAVAAHVHVLPRLHDHVARLQAARDERQVGCGRDTHSSAVSAATALAAAAACATRPGWWKANTVVSSHSARVSTPPSPTCATISASAHPRSSATLRSAARSTCLLSGNLGVRAVPHYPSRPRPREFLAHDARGHFRHRHLLAPRASSERCRSPPPPPAATTPPPAPSTRPPGTTARWPRRPAAARTVPPFPPPRPSATAPRAVGPSCPPSSTSCAHRPRAGRRASPPGTARAPAPPVPPPQGCGGMRTPTACTAPTSALARTAARHAPPAASAPWSCAPPPPSASAGAAAAASACATADAPS